VSRTRQLAPAGRICEAEGCGTELSRWNTLPVCSVHESPGDSSPQVWGADRAPSMQDKLLGYIATFNQHEREIVAEERDAEARRFAQAEIAREATREGRMSQSNFAKAVSKSQHHVSRLVRIAEYRQTHSEDGRKFAELYRAATSGSLDDGDLTRQREHERQHDARRLRVVRLERVVAGYEGVTRATCPTLSARPGERYSSSPNSCTSGLRMSRT